MRFTSALSIAASLSPAAAGALQGFNYGAADSAGNAIGMSQYQNLFTTAQNLVGTSGWTSARLYTMIQAGTTNTPSEALQAAINTKTSLLLGMWASAGSDAFNNELAALSSAISGMGPDLANLVQGISVGSEDLYRETPTGIANKAGVGADPDTLTGYISSVRKAIAGSALSHVSIGHVDTWTAWVNGSNVAVIDAVDWLGVDTYPYFQTVDSNSISNGKSLFEQALQNTQGVSQGKDVWVTETGWPVSGPTENQAEASIANAQTYWDQVACSLIGNVNTYWFTLQDASPTTPSPSFGLVGSTLSTTPLYNLTCPAQSASSSSSAAGSSSTGSSSSSKSPSSGGGSSTQGSSSSSSSIISSSSNASSPGSSNPSSTGSSSSMASGSLTSTVGTTSSGTGSSPSITGSSGSGSGSGSGSSTGSGTQATGSTSGSGSGTKASSTSTPAASNGAMRATGGFSTSTILATVMLTLCSSIMVFAC